MTRKKRDSFDIHDKVYLLFYPSTEELPKHLGENGEVENLKWINLLKPYLQLLLFQSQ